MTPNSFQQHATDLASSGDANQIQRALLSAFCSGMHRHAWWQVDGKRMVGNCGTTLKAACIRIETEAGYAGDGCGDYCGV